ncbi:ABC transporter ATPase, partial [Carbonactinospora thermoautotrophica]
MRPLDPRLLREARPVRAFLSASVAFGVAGAVLLVAQATLLADLVARTFLAGAGLAELSGGLATLAAVVVARAALAGLAETVAHRTSGAVKARLRQRLLAHAVALGPGALPGERT